MINLEDSIVLIKSVKKENVIGTGFIFHKQQNYTYLLTCAHVIKDVGGEENIRVNDLPAEVIKIGDVQGLDLAILKINTTFSASSLKLKKSRALVHLIDATEMFIRAISQERQNEGTPTPEGINNALLNTDFEGMTGQIKIIKDGCIICSIIWVMCQRDLTFSFCPHEAGERDIDFVFHLF